MIHKFELFDLNLKPSNIKLSSKGIGNESHSIQFSVGKKKKSVDEFDNLNVNLPNNS